MSDALEQAKEYLKDALQVYDREIMPAEVQFTAASIFVQIAIAEQMARQTEHLLYIRSHLTDLSTFFQNAEGAGGALKVTQ